MSVTVRPYVNGGWEVDIRVQLPDGSVVRERRKASASSKQAAQKWAESRERVLLVTVSRKRRPRRSRSRHRHRTRVPSDSWTAPRAEDREQRPDDAERGAQDSRRVGRHRTRPVLDQALRAPKSEASFYDFDEFERLVEAARIGSPGVARRPAGRRGPAARRRDDGARACRRSTWPSGNCRWRGWPEGAL
jgi:hypothetical protein